MHRGPGAILALGVSAIIGSMGKEIETDDLVVIHLKGGLYAAGEEFDVDPIIEVVSKEDVILPDV